MHAFSVCAAALWAASAVSAYASDAQNTEQPAGGQAVSNGKDVPAILSEVELEYGEAQTQFNQVSLDMIDYVKVNFKKVLNYAIDDSIICELKAPFNLAGSINYYLNLNFNDTLQLAFNGFKQYAFESAVELIDTKEKNYAQNFFDRISGHSKEYKDKQVDLTMGKILKGLVYSREQMLKLHKDLLDSKQSMERLEKGYMSEMDGFLEGQQDIHLEMLAQNYNDASFGKLNPLTCLKVQIDCLNLIYEDFIRAKHTFQILAFRFEQMHQKLKEQKDLEDSASGSAVAHSAPSRDSSGAASAQEDNAREEKVKGLSARRDMLKHKLDIYKHVLLNYAYMISFADTLPPALQSMFVLEDKKYEAVRSSPTAMPSRSHALEYIVDYMLDMYGKITSSLQSTELELAGLQNESLSADLPTPNCSNAVLQQDAHTPSDLDKAVELARAAYDAAADKFNKALDALLQLRDTAPDAFDPEASATKSSVANFLVGDAQMEHEMRVGNAYVDYYEAGMAVEDAKMQLGLAEHRRARRA